MLPSQLKRSEIIIKNDVTVKSKGYIILLCIRSNISSFFVKKWKIIIILIIFIIFIVSLYNESIFQYQYNVTEYSVVISSTLNNTINLTVSERKNNINLNFINSKAEYCLYNTDNSLNGSILSMGIGTNGYWTDLSSNSCINNSYIYCSGNISTLYDFFKSKYSIYRYNDTCVYHLYNRFDDSLLSCLSNRALLFLGDSTLEYLVYYSLLNKLLNVSIFEDPEHILREFEYSSYNFLNRGYNISIYYRYTSGWPHIYNNHGTAALIYENGKYGRLWNYIDLRYLSFNNITHIIYHSLFHDITHRTIYEITQNHRNISLSDHVEEYKNRLIKIYIGLLERLEKIARNNKFINNNDYRLYIWPSTHVGNEGDLNGLIFLFYHAGYYEWFNKYYDYYLYGMIEAINIVINKYIKYKNHLIFIDTSSMSDNHRNKYYGDGLHYGNGEHRDGLKRSTVVRDMMCNAILNEICLRDTAPIN